MAVMSTRTRHVALSRAGCACLAALALCASAQAQTAEERCLLDALRDAPPQDIDMLARLAQGTPPEARAALRRELLAQPPARRSAWLQAQLQR